jgi:hypothetical protein
MSLVPVFRFAAVVLLLVSGGSAAVMAQPGYPQRAPYGYAPPGYAPQQPVYRDQRAYPPGYYPGKLIQPAQPQPQQGFSLRRFFGAQDEAPPPARKPVAKPRKPAPPPAAVARQEKPKANPSTHVVVFGDTLADFARQGLDDMFSDDENVAVVPKVRGDSSLVRSDPAEWPNSIKATLDGGQKINLAVVMLGVNDRQSLKEGEETVELLSDRWKELYRQRVDAILRTFQERAIPVVWIGLPPMKSSKLTEDLLAMNEIYRESVQRHGGSYVDIWPGFVDDENRYIATGPDVDGEPAKLRANDGVSFTKAGARKVAHFADTDIKRILGTGQTGTAAAPQPGQPAPEGGQAAPSIEAALPAPPDAAAPVALPVKPLVGPVLPLTRPDVAPGGTLVSGAPKLNGDHAYPVQRALRAGVAPSARPGRADDYRWPPTP